MKLIRNIYERSSAFYNQQKGYGLIISSSNTQRVINFSKFVRGETKKRALVSYVVQPIVDELSGVKTDQFSNSGAGRTIPKVLNQLGYIVDIINWDDKGSIESNYDVIVFHGGRNFSQIEKLANSNKAKLIYYSTGSYWKYHNEAEARRAKYFQKRHGVLPRLDRKITDSEEKANQTADAIICLGNKDTAKTYSAFKNVQYIEGASMPISHPRKINPHEDGKIGVLFMAGPGNLHKGLDIVLDAWAEIPSIFELHIVTQLDHDLLEIYNDHLDRFRNIIVHGFVPQRSKEYYKIIDRCQYSILVSCSEGSPGSVIESIHQGLIPIVSRDSHIEVGDIGTVLSQDTVEEVAKTVKSLNTNMDEIRKSQAQLIRWGEKYYSLDKFENRLTKILQDIGL